MSTDLYIIEKNKLHGISIKIQNKTLDWIKENQRLLLRNNESEWFSNSIEIEFNLFCYVINFNPLTASVHFRIIDFYTDAIAEQLELDSGKKPTNDEIDTEMRSNFNDLINQLLDAKIIQDMIKMLRTDKNIIDIDVISDENPYKGDDLQRIIYHANEHCEMAQRIKKFQELRTSLLKQNPKFEHDLSIKELSKTIFGNGKVKSK